MQLLYVDNDVSTAARYTNLHCVSQHRGAFIEDPAYVCVYSCNVLYSICPHISIYI